MTHQPQASHFWREQDQAEELPLFLDEGKLVYLSSPLDFFTLKIVERKLETFLTQFCFLWKKKKSLSPSALSVLKVESFCFD